MLTKLWAKAEPVLDRSRGKVLLALRFERVLALAHFSVRGAQLYVEASTRCCPYECSHHLREKLQLKEFCNV